MIWGNIMKLRSTSILILVIVTGMFIVSAYAWNQLPEGSQIPIRFDLNGNPTSYGGKAMGLLFIPIIAVILTVLYITIPLVEPRSRHLQLSQQAYSATLVTTIAFLAIIHVAMTAIALEMSVDINMIIYLSLGIVLIVVGNFMSKTRSTFFFGIRTPWTLTSELSWYKTHRLGSRLFVIHGIGFLISGLVSSSALLIFLVVSMIVTTIVLLYYSYLVWKDDPKKLIDS